MSNALARLYSAPIKAPSTSIMSDSQIGCLSSTRRTHDMKQPSIIAKNFSMLYGLHGPQRLSLTHTLTHFPYLSMLVHQLRCSRAHIVPCQYKYQSRPDPSTPSQASACEQLSCRKEREPKWMHGTLTVININLLCFDSIRGEF